jgi:hypothetical protein
MTATVQEAPASVTISQALEALLRRYQVEATTRDARFEAAEALETLGAINRNPGLDHIIAQVRHVGSRMHDGQLWPPTAQACRWLLVGIIAAAGVVCDRDAFMPDALLRAALEETAIEDEPEPCGCTHRHYGPGSPPRP